MKESEEFSLDAKEIVVELRDRPGGAKLAEHSWPIAVVRGGIDKFSITHRGDTTTIKIVSPAGNAISDDWERPKRGRGSRKALNRELITGLRHG